jgi:hypothetical protein
LYGEGKGVFKVIFIVILKMTLGQKIIIIEKADKDRIKVVEEWGKGTKI